MDPASYTKELYERYSTIKFKDHNQFILNNLEKGQNRSIVQQKGAEKSIFSHHLQNGHKRSERSIPGTPAIDIGRILPC